MAHFVGIDLGTTFSVVAHVNAQGKPEVIPNEHGNAITPSIIYFGSNGPVVGDEAKERQASGETEIAAFFKRSMGDEQFLLSFYGRDYTPVDLSALVLGYLKVQAERFLKGSVTNAVITVPAYFTHTQRIATLEAGRKAGLNVLKIINEPTAAALAYGLRPSQDERRVLVYDLGGGTFDVSLVSITPTEVNVIATDGDHNLGGKDWDDRLLSYLADQFEQEFSLELLGDDVNELRVQAEKLKHTLSARQSASIRVQASGKTGNYTVTRTLFEDITRDLMERTQLLTEHVLAEVNLSWSALHGVLPVGGSTRMPMVNSYIERLSGKPAMGGVNPDEAVALGAAIQATMEMEQLAGPADTTHYLLSGRKKTTDVIAHSLGMIAESADRSHYTNSILIRKNLPIPSAQMRPYQMTVRRHGDTQLEVFLTQGESDDPQQCAYLGRYVFSDFPPAAGKTAILNITYEYDKNGIVHISAVEKASGKPLKLLVEPVPPDVPARFAGRPTDQQIRQHLTVYLVIDTSGSMEGGPLDEAKRAAERFIRECDLTSTSIGLILFSSGVHVKLEATQNDGKLHHAISSLRAGGGTSGASFDAVYDLLHEAPGRRYAIVLTDGQWSNQERAIHKARQCHQAEIEVIAIGFGQADRRFLEQIASSSEQSFFTDLSRLTETFSTIAQEITESAGEKRSGGKLRWTP